MKYYIIKKNKFNKVLEQLNPHISSPNKINDEYVYISVEDSREIYGLRSFTYEEVLVAAEKIKNNIEVSTKAKSYIRSSVVGEAEGRRFRGTGVLQEDIKEVGTHEFFHTLQADREMDGMRFKAYGADWRDKISMAVTDENGNVLDEYVTGWHLDEPTMLTVYRCKLKAGMKLKFIIETHGQDLKIWCDAFLHQFPN